MKKIANILTLCITIALLGASGCSTTHQPNSSAPSASQSPPARAPGSNAQTDSDTLQGTWKGRELTGNNDGPCYLIVSGKNFEFRGANKHEWYKGTFTLREDANPKQLLGSITECPDPKYNGKTSNAIYRLESGTLTLTANEPGSSGVPSSFEASDARRFVFKGQ
jgi:uncharacterized protein (TIGR03067 family)